MKTLGTLRTALVATSALLAAVTVQSQTNVPALVNRAFVGDHLFLGFRPATTGWVGIDRSLDLVAWAPLVSVSTTNDITEFVDEEAAQRPQAFYRLHEPGAPVEEAEARWSALNGADYEFRLQHTRSHAAPYVLSATVSVHGGQKTLSQAEADGQPLAAPEAADFPSVAELFELLREAQRAGCWRVAAVYDVGSGCPTWCVIERLSGSLAVPKHVDQYRVTGLVWLR